MFKISPSSVKTKLKNLASNLKALAIAFLIMGFPRMAMAQATSGNLKWSTAMTATDPLSQFTHIAIQAGMGVAILFGIFMIVLAFKGLFSDQQMQPFWIKLIGGCGALIGPAVYYWFSQQADTINQNSN